MMMTMNLDTKRTQYIDALDLMIMSVYRPDSGLRGEALDLGCFDDLMGVRDDVIDYLQHRREEAKRYEGLRATDGEIDLWQE